MPQQRSAPVPSNAHTCELLEEMATTPVSTSLAGGDETILVVIEPSPSAPVEPLPQQRTPPARISAQVCAFPATAASTPVSTSLAGGTARFTVVPSPSCPARLSPQQRRPPVSRIAHTWELPTATVFTPTSASTLGGVR